MPRDTRRVYSTDGGRVDSQPAREAPTPAGDGVVRVSRQTQGRKGRGVTVITGIPLAGEALKDLARELKQRPDLGLDAVGFVDNDRMKLGTEIQGLRVLGTSADLAELCREVPAANRRARRAATGR